MKFTDMIYALTDFCLGQDCGATATENEVTFMVEDMLTHCDDLCRNVNWQGCEIPKYEMKLFHQPFRKALPQRFNDMDCICDNGMIIGMFYNDKTAVNNKLVKNGWEIVYDLNDSLIRLVYKVVLTENDITTIYRVEDAYMDDFNFSQFIQTLREQIKTEILRVKEAECA